MVEVLNPRLLPGGWRLSQGGIWVGELPSHSNPSFLGDDALWEETGREWHMDGKRGEVHEL